ncbi:MAG: S9 family peptidase [Candidatus Limnocylindrales bacterium]|jgi:dipeptidyl aminopeptidase/acylaminoacyl peptidase
MPGVDAASDRASKGRTVAGSTRAAQENGRVRRPSRDGLTIEQAAAIESPREFRLSPDGRRVAFTAEAAGARQIFLMSSRGGYPEQLTATEKSASDPQWSPDGRRLAFVRDDAIWMIDVEGSHQALVSQHPAGNRAPRWCADGHQIAFISRRRGWDQLWLIDAPVPRRGRPATRPRSAEPVPMTSPGVDVDEFVWSPDGRQIAVTWQRLPDLLTSQIHLVDVVTAQERLIAGEGAWETGPRWLPDGSGLLMVSDRDGWFQVVQVSTDGKHRIDLTAGPREHGEPGGGWGYVPLPSPDGKLYAFVEIHDGLVDLLVGTLPAPASSGARGHGSGTTPAAPAVVNPFEGAWMAVGWMPDSSAVLAIGRSDRAPDDLWLLPVPQAAAHGARPRQLTHSLPTVVDAAHFATGTRVAFEARDGLRIEANLYLPADATGEEAVRVPCLVHSHGGPTSQALRDWFPFRQLVTEAGMAFLSVDFRGSTGYGRDFRWADRGEWGHADAFDVIDAARWAAQQPWCDGRLAHYGASYGGYMTLCVLSEEPSLWRAGIDLYGDSEIAESYRHGDRPGRIDLERLMGRPADPDAAEAYRRGSPVYRAERIEAPLLIMHGRKDKRVAPLMTEKMVEALEIEGKHYQVHWYEDEPHGWQKRENRRDAWKRCLEFLKRHLLEQVDED